MSSKKSRPDSQHQKDIDRLVARRIATLPPKAFVFESYFPELGVKETFIRVEAHPKSSITARVDYFDGAPIAEVDDFSVARRLRGHGIGQRLLQGLIVACKAQGIEHLYSDSMSNDALAVRQRVLGDSALQFYDGDSAEYYRNVLPLTAEQSRLSNDRIEALRPGWSHDRPFPGHVGVYVDLTGIDAASLPPVRMAPTNVTQ